MNAESIAALKKESEEHKTAVQQLRAEAQKREHLAKAIDIFVGQYEAASQHNGTPQELSKLTQAEAVYQLLRERGAMSKNWLFRALQQRGVRVKPASLSVVLSNDSRLESDGKGLWKVKE